MSRTIEIDVATLKILKNLEKQTGLSKKNILKRALDTYQRDTIVDNINAYYQSLRDNPKLWEDELAERKVWGSASNDGLEDL